MIDLFSIASSGVNASSKLLQTTSNNIANVNTQGYVREQTVFTNQNTMGVGRGTTERIINTFAQNQLRRDISATAELEALSQNTGRLDNILASEANSVSAGLSKLFSSLQTAADDPTNLTSREQVLSGARSLLYQMNTLDSYMAEKEKQLDLEFASQVKRANSLIENIGQLNEAVQVAYGNKSEGEPTALLTKRDNAINELASMMSIDVRHSTSQQGAVAINLRSGDSLVLENGAFNVVQVATDADLSFKSLQLANGFTDPKNPTAINLNESQLGGSLGGLYRFRNEVLGPTQRDIGQLGLALADAMNTQNKLGMDLDGQLGSNIFDMPTFSGLPYIGTPGTLSVEGQVTAGKGAELTDADYQIKVTSVNGAGVPDEIEVTLINGDGSPKKDASGNELIYPNIAVNNTGFTELPGGFEIDFTDTTGYSVDNEFLFQPTKGAPSSITLTTERPEDLAFAAPIRVEPALANLGNASVANVSITNTEVGPDGSAFDGAGGIHNVGNSPSPTVGAPTTITFTSATEFEVYDSAGSLITTVSGVTDYNNLLTQAKASGGWSASYPTPLDDYPGYDVSLDGLPRGGDSFDISFNTNGFSDNTNALTMADLQDGQLVQTSSEPSNKPRSMHDAYASVVGRVGENAASADTSLQAAQAMKVQSENWFDSVSGVNLDEEAANLIRFQQSYAASARILSTAQELFDTILSAAR